MLRVFPDISDISYIFFDMASLHLKEKSSGGSFNKLPKLSVGSYELVFAKDFVEPKFTMFLEYQTHHYVQVHHR